MARLHRHAVGRRFGCDGERGDVPGWVLITAMTVAHLPDPSGARPGPAPLLRPR
jgi:hypothetical protein